MALKPTWARIQGMFVVDKDPVRQPGAGSASPSLISARTSVQDWDWDLPPAACANSGEEEPLKHVTPVASEDESRSRKEQRIVLEEEVASLRRTLTHEGNIHRALERALKRASGVLPRLPADIPPDTRVLLAEVALLEEEVTRLEGQVVFLRENLYKEALLFSCATQRLQAKEPVKIEATRIECNKEPPSSNAKPPEPASSQHKLPPSKFSDDSKKKTLKNSVVAKLLQTGGRSPLRQPQRVQAPAPSSSTSAKADVHALARMNKVQPKKLPSSSPKVEGTSAGHRRVAQASVQTKTRTAKHASSRNSSARASPQLSPRASPRGVPSPRMASSLKNSPSASHKVAPKPQIGAMMEKENLGVRQVKALPAKSNLAPGKMAAGSGKAKLSASASATPSASPSRATAGPLESPAAPPTATPSSAPKLQPLSAGSTPKFLPLSSGYFQDGLKSEANKLSEEMVSCLMDIYCKLAGIPRVLDVDGSSSLLSSRSTSPSSSSSRSVGSGESSTRYTVFSNDSENDPYGVCCEGMARDVGAYAEFREITATSFDRSRVPASAALYRKHRELLKKLSMVDLRGLRHKQKLAFWINTYNVCMMHAFLEHGIPSSPHKTFALMRKAAINVGGYLLSPLTIEHFILRLPPQSRQQKLESLSAAKDESQQSAYGLQWSEPLVSFALSCGSRSSPAVRVYTAVNVDAQLEAAKRDYLEAAIGMTIDSKIIIPKLLEWYVRDFAKDAQSLLEWICDQLPPSLQEAMEECMENVEPEDFPQHIEVMPYNFEFRYLFAC